MTELPASKKARCHNTGRADKALNEGQRKATDVVARKINHVEGLHGFSAAQTGDPPVDDRDKVAENPERNKPEVGKVALRGYLWVQGIPVFA